MTLESHRRAAYWVAATLALMLAAAPAAPAADQGVTATPSNTFSPKTVTVNQGESVAWTNAGGYHNVHFDDDTFIAPPNVSLPPWTVSRTFDQVGSFTYFCDAHSFVGMTGTVNVVPVEPPLAGGGTPAGTAPVSGQATSTVCASKRRFTIRLRGLERVRVRSVRVEFNGKELPVRTQLIDGRRRRTADVDMRGLPRGSYTVAIAVTATDGTVLRGTRIYRTCAGKLASAGLPTL
jgi:plastocyanin